MDFLNKLKKSKTKRRLKIAVLHIILVVAACAVVGSFFCDVDIVRMRFTKTCICNANKLSSFLKFCNSFAAAVTHTCADTAEKLEDRVGNRSFVRNAAFNAFGNELNGVLLEVSVLGALFHRSKRTHTTVNLKASAHVDFFFAGAFLTTCKERTKHNSICTCSKSLNHIAAILDTTVCNNGDIVFCSSACRIINSSDLRNTDTCNDTSCADRTGADTNLNSVSTCKDHILSSRTCSYVTANDLAIGVRIFNLVKCIEHALSMAVSRVKNENVNTCSDKSACSVKNVSCYTDRSTAEESAVSIFCGIGIFGRFLNIFDRNKTGKLAFFINDRKLFYFTAAKYLLSLFMSCAFRSSNKIFSCHNIVDRHIHSCKETHITVCNDTNKITAVVHDRHTGDPVFVHKFFRFVNFVFGVERERISDNAILTSLNLFNLVSLKFDRHILMNNTDTAFASHSNSHICFSNSIHSRRYNGCVKCDFVSEASRNVYIRRYNVTFRRDKKDIVKSQAFFVKFFAWISVYHKLSFTDQTEMGVKVFI